VSAWLDTNVLIRRLTGDPPEQAARATRLLARAERLLLADLIVAEVVYVLESFYEVPRPRVVELVRAIIAFVRRVEPSRNGAGAGSARRRS
jgi:predicted nucleic acid-binding protein